MLSIKQKNLNINWNPYPAGVRRVCAESRIFTSSNQTLNSITPKLNCKRKPAPRKEKYSF